MNPDTSTAPAASPTPTANIPTRLNNPGDLRYIGQTGGQADPSGFASFPDPKTGFAALLNDVQSKINTHPDDTIADFANTYAPNSDGNNSAEYAANLSNKLGVSPDTKLSALQGNIGQFAEAIGNNEGYQGSNTTPDSPDDATAAPMSTGEKIALGLSVPLTLAAGFFTGGAADTAVPEELAALGISDAGVADGASGASTFASKVASATKGAVASKVAGLAGGIGLGGVASDIFNNVTGNNPATAATAAGDEESAATAAAGAQESAATTAAAQEQTQEEEQIADEQETQAQIRNSESLMNAQKSVMNSYPTGQTLMQNPDIQAGMMSNAVNGFLPEYNAASGKLDSTKAFQKADDAVGDLAKGTSEVLDTEGKSAPIRDVENSANDYIDQYANTPEEADAAKAAVAKNISSYKNKYGGSSGEMSLGQMERSKIGEYKAGKFDVRTPSHESLAHRAIGVGFRNTVGKHTDHKELYKRALKKEAEILKGKKVLKFLHGKKAPEKKSFFGNVGKHYGKYVGTYIGEKIGGPFGAVVGTMVGDSLIKSVDKRIGKNFFESKTGKKIIELAATRSKTQRAAFAKAFKKAGVKVPKTLLLEAPKKGGARTSFGSGSTVPLHTKTVSTQDKEERNNPKIRQPQNSAQGPLGLPAPSSNPAHVAQRLASKSSPTPSVVRANPAGTLRAAHEKLLGTNETKNAKMNRETRIPLSQGLSRFKATGGKSAKEAFIKNKATKHGKSTKKSSGVSR